MDASDYYLPAAALWSCLAVKFPGLMRGWRDPLVRSVCIVIFLGGCGFFFAAPPTIEALNNATGVANFSGPLVYVIVSAFSASCLLLIIYWRGGPPEYVRRTSRRWCIGYLVLITTLIVLFALGDAPVNRLTDFDTYYATTPFIGEMILLYLLGHMAAAVVTTVLCWRWALHVRGWLRIGLWILVAGWLLNLAFSSLKLAAVAGRWAGQDWSVLSTTLAPLLSAVAAVCATVGFLLPLVGPWLVSTWDAVARSRRLEPLWRELSSASSSTPLATKISPFSSPQVRLTRREAGIHDGLRLIRPYLDESIRSRAQVLARNDGHTREEALLIGYAAMIAAAASATLRGRSVASAATENPVVLTSHEVLEGVSRALRASPIVTALRNETAKLSAQDGEKTAP